MKILFFADKLPPEIGGMEVHAHYFIQHFCITDELIIISHNATIPMLADAQNIILCRNMNGKIVIRSGAMEDSIDGKRVIDSIAEITDGGKASVKKRVKKYNLKSFKED